MIGNLHQVSTETGQAYVAPSWNNKSVMVMIPTGSTTMTASQAITYAKGILEVAHALEASRED